MPEQRPRSPREDTNRRMLRARDEMDRRFAEPLDVPTLAAVAHLSPSQFGRVFKDVFGETPHRYLQRRRVERAMTLLRQTNRPVTDIAWDVGFASLGTFSRTFSNVVGRSPSEFRTEHAPVAVPSCFIAAWTRPRERQTVVSEKRGEVDAD
jgi:transcriptional regulator GlxA family with amidase domain